MGKKGGSSWLTAVKRAFRSPSKEDSSSPPARKAPRVVVQVQDDEGKRRRWLFRRSSSPSPAPPPPLQQQAPAVSVTEEQRHAIALAVATAATAEAAVATAHAAAEVVRLTSSTTSSSSSYYAAAVVIQTAFRGYLARRALRALKGLVKLQALVRGHNVRKRADMTLRCMQALVRVQARVRHQRMRLASISLSAMSGAAGCGSSNSSYSSASNFWGLGGGEDDRPRTVEEIQALLHTRKDAALKRDAFSHQIWMASRASLDTNRSTTSIRGVAPGRASMDHHQQPVVKTLEVDTARPFSYSTPRRHPSNITPSPGKARPPIQVRSASPRSSIGGGSSYTPSLVQRHAAATSSVPGYMAATASAKARARSQSAPRQRPATPERDRLGSSGAKKRLSYPAAPPVSDLRSPSFKSAAGRFSSEQRSTVSSSCADSLWEPVSPSSTTDLGRWLR